MKPFGAFFLLFLGPLALLLGQTAEASVFVDTEPMGARIEVDGRLVPEATPALLRGLAPGPHTLSLWHEGYALAVRSVTVGPGPVPVVEVDLPPGSMVLAFPEVPAIADGTGALGTAGRQFRFPEGTYKLAEGGGAARFTPAFADEGLLAVAGWALVLVAGASAVSAASDAYQITTGWADHPSLLTAALAGTAVLELPWYLSLSGRKARFLKDTSPVAGPLAENLDQTQDLWDKGEAALETGDLAEAEPFFSRLVRAHPDSRLVPGAWFRLAKIHSITGRKDLAAGEYRLVAVTYPQAAYYNRARKALADLDEAAGDPVHALENLDALVPDDLFAQADLDAQRTWLTAAMEASPAP